MKSKLVSRNPVQRFKLGKQILFAQNGLGRWFYNGKEVFSDDGGKTFKLNESGRLTGAPGAVKNLVRADKVGKGAYKVGNSWYKIGGNGRPAVVTETPLKAIRQKNGSMIYKMPDGTWRNEKGQRLENFVSHQQAPIKKEVPTAGKPVGRNTQAATPPQSTVTPSPSQSIVQFTPGIINNGQFTPTGETTTQFDKTSLIPQFKPKPQETFGPGTFNTNVTYNSGNIRANRGVNYSNVNEYWDYLNNNKDSNDYKLFQNIMRTTDGNLNRDVFDQTMAKYGISGNLGRRDSGRLANLLNDLNLIGTEGSDARNSFIDSYNNHFNLAQKEAPVKQWTPQGQDWRSNLQNVLSLSYRKKGGTLSSRNPITRFKANFRLVAQ